MSLLLQPSSEASIRGLREPNAHPRRGPGTRQHDALSSRAPVADLAEDEEGHRKRFHQKNRGSRSKYVHSAHTYPGAQAENNVEEKHRVKERPQVGPSHALARRARKVRPSTSAGFGELRAPLRMLGPFFFGFPSLMEFKGLVRLELVGRF